MASDEQLQTIKKNFLSAFDVELDDANPKVSINAGLRKFVDLLNDRDGATQIEFDPQTGYTTDLGKDLLEAVSDIIKETNDSFLVDFTESDAATIVNKLIGDGMDVPYAIRNDPVLFIKTLENAGGVIAALNGFYNHAAPEIAATNQLPDIDVAPVSPKFSAVAGQGETNDLGAGSDEDFSLDDVANLVSKAAASVAEELVVAAPVVEKPAAKAEPPVTEKKLAEETHTQNHTDLEIVQEMLSLFVPVVNGQIEAGMAGAKGLVGLLGGAFGPKEVKMPGDDINESLQGVLPLVLKELGIKADESWRYRPELGQDIKEAFPEMLGRKWGELKTMAFPVEIDELKNGVMNAEMRASIKGAPGMGAEKYAHFEKSLSEFQKLNRLVAGGDNAPLNQFINSLNNMDSAGQITDDRLGTGSALGNGPLGGFLRTFVGFLAKYIPGVGDMIDRMLPGLGIKDALEQGGRRGGRSSSENMPREQSRNKPEATPVVKSSDAPKGLDGAKNMKITAQQNEAAAPDEKPDEIKEEPELAATGPAPEIPGTP